MLRAAVVGATGIVGQQFIVALDKHKGQVVWRSPTAAGDP